MQLPRSLICLILEYVIQDIKIIEHCLAVDPETIQYCIVVILRKIIRDHSIETVSVNANVIYRCLRVLWAPTSRQPCLLARLGAVEILPYIIKYRHIINEIKMMTTIAAANGHLSLVRYLITNYSSKYILLWDYAVRNAAINGHASIVSYALAFASADIKQIASPWFAELLDNVKIIYESNGRKLNKVANYVLLKAGDHQGSYCDYQDVINILHYFIKYKEIRYCSVSPNSRHYSAASAQSHIDKSILDAVTEITDLSNS